MSKRYCLILHDRDSWTMKIIKRGECVGLNEFVLNSRHQDECWAKRFNGDYAYPAPRKHFSRPRGGGNAVRLTLDWWNFTRDINLLMTGNLDGWDAGRTINGGWINYASNKNYGTKSVPDQPDEFPVVEGITGIVYNIHEVLETKNNSARIKTFKIRDNPPDPMLFNPYTNPESFVLFPSINDKGILGYAPQGKIFWFPLLARDEAWLTYDKIELDVAPPIPEEKSDMPIEIPGDTDMPRIERPWGLDLSKWNGNYNDDGIDEGFPDLSFVVLKSWDGKYDRTSDINSTFKAQYDSVASIPHKGGYGWYQTEPEFTPIGQADLALSIADKKLFDFMPVDYEGYLNVIDERSANDLATFVEHFRDRSPLKVPIYTNGWILTMLRAWLGSWMDTVDIWFAGGEYYNQPLLSPIADTIVPNIPETFTFWQFSADGNMAADEFDFSVSENESIDVNVFNGTELDLAVYLDKADDGTELPSETGNYNEGFNAALDKMNNHSMLIRKP